MGTKKSKGSTDRRLLGYWRSDKLRTLRGWKWKPGMSSLQRRRFSKIFGHLLLHYTRTKIHSAFKGTLQMRGYRILGSDADSVAIMYDDFLTTKPVISHIHFDGPQRYWITVGSQREWFKKTTKPSLQ